jgi:hypothetical protein
MMEKLAQAGEAGEMHGIARPSPFTLFTTTYKVAVYIPAEKADTFPLFDLYPFVLCGTHLHGFCPKLTQIFSVHHWSRLAII